MTGRLSQCVEAGCSNFGNPRKQGYCNAHANARGISEGERSAVVCPYVEQCHNAVGRGYAGRTVVVDGIELPNGFTKISEREPVPGDAIISIVEMGAWLLNSYGRVAAVNPTAGSALIHFACDSVYNMSYNGRNRGFYVIE